MLIVAALWYLAVTSVLMVGQYYIEDRPAARPGSRASRQASVNASGTTPKDPLPEVEL